MKRSDLEHILRAAAGITPAPAIAEVRLATTPLADAQRSACFARLRRAAPSAEQG